MALSLKTAVNGMQFENPFLLASGPPGTNAKVIAKSYDLGWGGVVCKTISLDASKVINTAPRYGKLKAREDEKVVVGFENIELISDRPFDAWLDEFRQLKKSYPKKILIASIMEEYRREAWHEIVRIVEEVVGWVRQVATIPVWAKMTPNVGNPAVPARAAVKGGADGISTINTLLSIIGVDLRTLKPMPTVEGYTVAGGYSGQAVRPIALRHVMEIARAIPGVPISGMGGIETGFDAAQFFLLGSHTVQVCTGAMLQGYEIIAKLKEELIKVMTDHHFDSVQEMVAKSLPYFSTHADLVQRQKAAKAAKVGNAKDAETWKGEIKKEADALVFN